MDNTSNHFPLNLQFFAEPGGTGDGTADPAPPADPQPPADPTPPNDPPKTPSFSDLLKTDKAFQSEFDKRVAGAIATAKGKWDAEAQLSADELAEKQRTEAENALKDREAALTARELKADMLTEIGKRGLPAALIDAVSLADKDAAAASLGNVEKAFRDAVDAEVKKKLAGNPPSGGNGGGGRNSFLQNFRSASGLKESGK